jgi:hypothetical protein
MAYGVSNGYPIASWTTAQRNDYYQRIAAAGFTKLRVEINAAGAGDNFELHVTSILAAGLKILGIVNGNSTETTTTYGTKCTAVANKYRATVFEWELMNEPNLQPWASGNAYATVAKAGSDAIKASYVAGGLPAPTIHLGGISNYGAPGNASIYTPWAWLTSVYTLAAGHAWFDVVPYHPYGFGKNLTGAQAFGSTAGWQIMADVTSVNSLRTIMTSNGDSAKKICVGENGAPTWSDGVVSTDWPSTTSSDPVGMTEQAEADFHSLCIADWKTRAWAQDYYVYSFKDRWSDVGATAATKEGHFGLVRSNFSQKAAYPVVVAAIAPTAPPPPPTQTITTRAAARGPVTTPNVIVTRAAARGPVALTADVTAPACALTAPADLSTVNGPVTITATATDNIAVARVDFLVDGIVVGTNTSPPSPSSISWNSTQVPNGSHTLTARATDTSGNQTTSASRSVTVNNAIVLTSAGHGPEWVTLGG